MKDNIKKILVLNTLANYGLSITRFFTQIILTRVLFLNLGQVSYGFWALLWSVFGYSLLLDFGFGTSVQKYTAEAAVTKDFKNYNQQLSTVITTYGFMAIIIIITTLGLAQVLDKLFIFPDGTDIGYFKTVFIFFGIGASLTFPSGAFTEILRGLNKIYLRNLVNFVTLILNFVGILIIFKLGYGLLELAIFSVLINITSNFLMAVFCFRLLPDMRISPRLFRFDMLKEVISFSLFAYLIMFANIIIFKTDQIVLGIMLGVTAVTIYQVASRFANLLLQFTTQFQESLTPIAAGLFKDGQVDRLRRIMFNSNRIIAVITTVLFMILTTLIRPILLIWLDISPDDPQYADSYPSIIAIVYLLNISMFLLLLFRSGSTKVLLMTGFHKFLSYVAVFESLMNVGFSILFIKLIGVVGVAVGTLIPNVILGLFFIFPKAAQFTKISVIDTIKRIYLPLAIVSIPSFIFLTFVNTKIPLQSWNFLTLVWVSIVTAILYFIPAWFLMANSDERNSIKTAIKTKLKIK